MGAIVLLVEYGEDEDQGVDDAVEAVSDEAQEELNVLQDVEEVEEASDLLGFGGGVFVVHGMWLLHFMVL
ncbi:MAG TPA: hypothetical protein PK869_02800 [Candidatus Hydrogenedentes bacterium]|nr:hypothetical protein [Candidatus Hydrogenedentota bacterium]